MKQNGFRGEGAVGARPTSYFFQSLIFLESLRRTTNSVIQGWTDR